MILEQAQAFQADLNQEYQRTPFPQLADGTTLLAQCLGRLSQVPRTLTLRQGLAFRTVEPQNQAAWVAATNSCSVAARVMGESFGTPLRGTVGPAFEEDEERGHLGAEQIQALWASLVERISGWARPNAANAERLLDRFGVELPDLATSLDLEESDVDIFEVRDKLEEYQNLTRGDFGSAEEFSEGRAEAWQEFLEVLSAQKLEQ